MSSSELEPPEVDQVSISSIVSFVLELEKLKGVTRKVKPLGLARYENSAEHSWQLALFASSLARYAEEGTNIQRVVSMLLVHDIGEIDTGDTIAFQEEGLADRKAAEYVAVARIFGMLGAEERDAFLGLWEEFEKGETKEARFAHAVDRAMPVLLNLANNGQSWKENGISYERVVKRIRVEIHEGCPALWKYLEVQLLAAREKEFFGA